MLAMAKSLVQVVGLLLGEIDEDLKVESIAGKVTEMVLNKLSPDINQLAYMSESLKASSSSVEKLIDSLSDLPSPVDSDSDSLQKLRVELENSHQSQADVSKVLLSGLQDITQKLDAAIK